MRVWAEWTWAQKISFIILIASSLANVRAVLLKHIDSGWRTLYTYRAITLVLFSFYTSLLLFGVLEWRQYSKITQWFLPLIFLGILWNPVLHILEEREIKRRKNAEMALDSAGSTGSTSTDRMANSKR